MASLLFVCLQADFLVVPACKAHTCVYQTVSLALWSSHLHQSWQPSRERLQHAVKVCLLPNCSNREPISDAEPISTQTEAGSAHAAVVCGCHFRLHDAHLTTTADPSINQSINQSINHQSINESTNQPTNRPINQSTTINQVLNQPINQPINQPTNRPILFLFLVLGIIA